MRGRTEALSGTPRLRFAKPVPSVAEGLGVSGGGTPRLRFATLGVSGGGTPRLRFAKPVPSVAEGLGVSGDVTPRLRFAKPVPSVAEGLGVSGGGTPRLRFATLGVSGVIALLMLTLSACGKRATPEECGEIFDRIVEVELRERGFRDAALVDLKRKELRDVLAPELKECPGKRLEIGALVCVRRATSAETMSHECLR